MRTWAEIDLKSISHNICELKKRLNHNTKLMAVVKADAYGHGYEKISLTAINAGADELAVASSEEAISLRKSNINVPILILGMIFNDDIENIIKYDITSTVDDYNLAIMISKEAVRQNKTAKVHIKIDTGMARLGYQYNDDYINDIVRISKLPNLNIEGIFSHFSKADEKESDFCDIQFDRFMTVCKNIEEKGIKIPVKHICNSAGVLRDSKYHLDMVRVGISIYGHYPSSQFDQNDINIIPAMTVKSKIIHIKHLKEDTKIGYGGRYTGLAGTKIATVAIGYADGFPRILSKDLKVTVNGVKCTVVGNVCMDQLMIDVSEVPTIKFGDEVIIFGKCGKNNITVEEVASLANTINYEILCRISKRVPRIYI